MIELLTFLSLFLHTERWGDRLLPFVSVHGLQRTSVLFFIGTWGVPLGTSRSVSFEMLHFWRVGGVPFGISSPRRGHICYRTSFCSLTWPSVFTRGRLCI